MSDPEEQVTDCPNTKPWKLFQTWKSRKGIYQGGSLSPLLFWLTIDPLIMRWEVLCAFSDSDLKLYADSDAKLNKLVQIVHNFWTVYGLWSTHMLKIYPQERIKRCIWESTSWQWREYWWSEWKRLLKEIRHWRECSHRAQTYYKRETSQMILQDAEGQI